MILLFFPLAITLHNIEEALWLPRWSKNASKFHKPVDQDVFNVAVIIVTILAYLSTFFYTVFPDNIVFTYILFGFIGAMCINVLAPHLIATIFLKKYCPGLLTGLLLMLPVNLTILTTYINKNVISLTGLLIATAVVGGILLGMLPLLFKLGKMIIKDL